MTDKQLVNLYRSFYLLGDYASLKILFELDRYGEKTFSELRDNLKINPATLSKKLKQLVQAELLVTDKSQDMLRVYYSLHKHQRYVRKILDGYERLSSEL